MRLKLLNEEIAKACNVRPQVVAAIQAETFRRIRAAVEKGEKVNVPDWGVFMPRDMPGKEGEPPRKAIRFRDRVAEAATKAMQDAAAKTTDED